MAQAFDYIRVVIRCSLCRQRFIVHVIKRVFSLKSVEFQFCQNCLPEKKNKNVKSCRGGWLKQPRTMLIINLSKPRIFPWPSKSSFRIFVTISQLMSIFATYFDQTMSSSEEEEQAIQHEKVKRRKAHLLNTLNTFIYDSRLPRMINGETGVQCELCELKTFTQMLYWRFSFQFFGSTKNSWKALLWNLNY